jgi:Zn-finger nucleic acid-binding protein
MPYREAEILLPCPRCGASLARDRENLKASCLDGCGDFVTERGIPELLGDDLQRARPSGMWWKDSQTACPSCKAPMKALTLGDARLYRCTSHGVWLDRSSSPLAETLAEARRASADQEQEQHLLEERRLVEGLLRRDETVALEIASRLLEVERRTRKLEAALEAALDQLAAQRSK